MFFMQVLHEELARLREQRKVLKDQIKEQTKQQRNLLARRRRLLQASWFDILIVGVGFLPTQIEAARNLSREDLELLLLRGVDLCRCAGKPVGRARVAQISYAGEREWEREQCLRRCQPTNFTSSRFPLL